MTLSLTLSSTIGYSSQNGFEVMSCGYHNDGVNNIATIWKDGVRTNLPSVTGNDASGKAIYVYVK